MQKPKVSVTPIILRLYLLYLSVRTKILLTNMVQDKPQVLIFILRMLIPQNMKGQRQRREVKSKWDQSSTLIRTRRKEDIISMKRMHLKAIPLSGIPPLQNILERYQFTRLIVRILRKTARGETQIRIRWQSSKTFRLEILDHKPY